MVTTPCRATPSSNRVSFEDQDLTATKLVPSHWPVISSIFCSPLTHPRFVSITPLYAPTAPGSDDHVYITKTYDATSHFETVVEDVFDVWHRVKGQPLVLKKREVQVEA